MPAATCVCLSSVSGICVKILAAIQPLSLSLSLSMRNVANVQQYQSAAAATAALLCQLIADFKPLSLTT